MKVYLYVLNTLADWEIGFLTAEINSARYLDKSKGKTDLIKIGKTIDPIKTMGGISVTPDDCIDNINFQNDDILILPGADTWLEKNNQDIINIAAQLLNKNITIAAICGATIALAKNGLLNAKKHTSNNKEYLKMICPDYSGGDFYIDAPAAVDENLITATGIAPLEFSYEIFKKTSLMKNNTLEAWYYLYKTNDPEYYYKLMESLD